MVRFRKLLPLAAAFAGLLGLAAPARATMVLALQEDGGAITTVATGASLSTLVFNSSFGDFQVTVLSGTADNGNPSDLLSSTTSVANLDTSGALHTLKIYVSSQDYTLPVGPTLAVKSGAGGTYVTGVGTLTFEAFADANNTLGGNPALNGTIPNLPAMSFNNGNQIANPPSGTGTTFDTGDNQGLFTRGAGNYSLTTVTAISLSGSTADTLAKLNYSNHEFVSSVPAPAGLVMALTGLPLLGIGGWLRRRAVRA